jgi:hypothetical protein
MLFHLESGGPTNLSQELGEITALEFGHLAASTAQHVVPMPRTNRCIAVTTAFRMNAVRQALLGEQLERAVHGDQAYAGMMAPSSTVGFGRSERAIGAGQDANDLPARAGDTVASVREGLDGVRFRIHPTAPIEKMFQ